MSKFKKGKTFAKKSLGQNFLIDQNIIDKIISSLNPQKEETIIEIGAGRGALTEKIVEKAGKVLAIEIDRDLIPVLRVKFYSDKNFHLIEQDALEIDFKSLVALQSPAQKTKLVANLPYYISTAILQHLIKYRHSFSEMVLMLQKEVVERITAEIGNKERGFLTVLIKAYFDSEKLFDVSPDSFEPTPKVTSSVMRLITKDDAKFKIEDEILFRKIVSLGFGQKRKTINNNLKYIEDDLKLQFEKKGGISKIFENIGIDPKSRAETIPILKWIKFCNYISENQ